MRVYYVHPGCRCLAYQTKHTIMNTNRPRWQCPPPRRYYKFWSACIDNDRTSRTDCCCFCWLGLCCSHGDGVKGLTLSRESRGAWSHAREGRFACSTVIWLATTCVLFSSSVHSQAGRLVPFNSWKRLTVCSELFLRYRRIAYWTIKQIMWLLLHRFD